MTEEEWLSGIDPEPMLIFLKGKASDRKLRLFACACCRNIWNLLERDSRIVQAVCTAEAFADGAVTVAVLRSAHAAITNMSVPADAERDFGIGFQVAWYCAVENQEDGTRFAAKNFANAIGEVAYLGKVGEGARDIEEQRAARTWGKEAANRAKNVAAILLRDIFGNPFRSMTAEASWLTSDAVTLAEGIYQERAFERMPILADAIQDAGCNNEDVLNHCRQPGEHVRGCWVVDLLTGRK